MSKIFDMDLYHKSVGIENHWSWADECVGLTAVEMKKLGYITSNSWMKSKYEWKPIQPLKGMLILDINHSRHHLHFTGITVEPLRDDENKIYGGVTLWSGENPIFTYYTPNHVMIKESYYEFTQTTFYKFTAK